MATALLEKRDAKWPEAAQAEAGPVPYHWTVDTLYRALDAGVFEHPERLELIHGEIIEHMGQNPPHSSLASEIADMLRAAFPSRHAIREEKPIHIASDGEPIPDVCVVVGKQSDYRDHHPAPQDVALLVEVADSSVAYDLGEKALLYAQAGVTDYWVVLVNEATFVRHRGPALEGYKEVTRLAGGDTLSPLAAPEAVWTVNAMLGHEE